MRSRVLASLFAALMASQFGCAVKSTVTPPKSEGQISEANVSSTVEADAAAKTKVDGNNISFEHIVGKSPCPQKIAEITLTSPLAPGNLDYQVQFEVMVSPPLSADPVKDFFRPDDEGTIEIFFDCSQQTSFTGNVKITHWIIGDEAQKVEIVYKVSGNVHR